MLNIKYYILKSILDKIQNHLGDKMAKIIHRLDLTQEEFDLIKDKLDEDLIKKIKKIKISDKKIASVKKALSFKTELARIRFTQGLIELSEKGIEATQYNLKKYKNISYPTSKKHFEFLKVAETKDEDYDLSLDKKES